MHGFESAILAIFPFCQNGTFERVHEIQKLFFLAWSLAVHVDKDLKKKV